MRDPARRSPARILAPLALVLFTVAVVAIVMSSTAGSDDERTNERGSRAGRTAPARERTTRTAPRPRGNTYTVKVGDTLGGISEKTGVPVEQLLELNPNLDPQALVSGQKIKLRE
jgi:Tfp pilus assembly protein FimV